MAEFHGFPEGKIHLVPLPATVFSELLPEIDHLGELKVILYTYWRLDQMEGDFRCLRREDYQADSRFMSGLARRRPDAEKALIDALERAVQRGALLSAEVDGESGRETLYFLNSPRGRAAVTAIEQGKWRPVGLPSSLTLEVERPNIYRLYEQNIGPLTPMIAEMLRDAEGEYSPEWLEDALRIAVKRNARNWHYVEAILRKWKEKGRDEQDRRNAESARQRYDEGELADFIDN